MKFLRSERNSVQPLEKADVKGRLHELADLEVDLLDEVLKSRKRAWQIVVASGALTVASFGLSAFVVNRYSHPVPSHILTWDKNTGAVQEVSLTRDEKTYGEVTDTYWVSQFVDHFETYDFNTAQKDYNTVSLMADSTVANQYMNKYRWGTAEAADKLVGDSESTRVHINSVILDRDNQIATVRFTTTKKLRSRPIPEPSEYWIATMSYRYESSVMTAQQRMLNPMGLRISSYRVNAETANRVGG